MAKNIYKRGLEDGYNAAKKYTHAELKRALNIKNNYIVDLMDESLDQYIANSSALRNLTDKKMDEYEIGFFNGFDDYVLEWFE